MVQTEALALFAAKGYHQTSIDEIAHAAAISPRTFFRYFTCKEDVVLWDEYDDLVPQELWQIQRSDNPLSQLIRRIRDTTAEVYHKEPERLLARTRLSYTVPEIRARFVERQMTMIGPYFTHLADAVGAGHDDLHLAVTLASVYAALLVALERWQRHDGQEDLRDLIDDAIGALATGPAYMAEAVRSATAATRNSRTQANPPGSSTATGTAG
jgi:AcrR family transcriptional regulator